MKKFKAFTLAEVLITLGIIGIVAAITIPVLMQNSNETAMYTAFKKKYSEISAATGLIMYNNGGSLNASSFTTSRALLDEYGKYLSFIKTCDGPNIWEDCWKINAVYRFDNGSAYGDDSDWDNAWISAAVLKDGTIFQIYLSDFGTFCNDKDNLYPECARLGIDVNGSKKPNTVGKDIFMINLHQTKLGYGNEWGDGADKVEYGGVGVGMTGYCLINKCPK